MPIAQAEWKRVVRELVKRGTVTRIDGSLLENYVVTYARWKNCIKRVLEDGEVIEQPYFNRDGNLVGKRVIVNPAAKQANQLSTAMRQCCAILEPPSHLAARRSQQRARRGE